MEENNPNELNGNDSVITTKKSYITGIIGAIIGGAIASLPWVLVYVYGNMIVAILAILIALGAFQGYKICKGKMGKLTPMIIAITSIAIILLLTTVVCPMIMLKNEGIDPSFELLQRLYKNQEMMSALMQDTLVSLAFTVIGIAGTIKSISMQIKSGVEDVKFSEAPLIENFQNELKEKAETVKKAFEGLGALSKDSAADKNEILNELEMTYNLEKKVAKANFQILYANRVIKKANGKYYYDVENEENNVKGASRMQTNKKSVLTAVIIVVVIVVLAIIMAAVFSENTNENEKVAIPNTDIKISVKSNMNVYDTTEEIATVLGENYAENYDLVVLNDNENVEIDFVAIEKEYFAHEDGEEHTLQELVEEEMTYIKSYLEIYGFENLSEIQSKKLGKTEFLWYSYSYNYNNEEYLVNVMVADIGDSFLFLECYAEGNQSKIDSMLNTLFK